MLFRSVDLVYPKNHVKNGAPAKKRARKTVFPVLAAAAAQDDDSDEDDDPAVVATAKQRIEACHKSDRSFRSTMFDGGEGSLALLSKVEYAKGERLVTQRCVVQRFVAKTAVE